MARGRKPNIKAPVSGLLKRMPPVPGWLHDYAKAEWKRVGNHLVQRGVLAETDIAIFTSYCVTTANIRIIMEGCRDKALGSLQQNLVTQRQLAAELGLSPASRSKAGVGTDTRDDDDLSALDI